MGLEKAAQQVVDSFERFKNTNNPPAAAQDLTNAINNLAAHLVVMETSND